MYLEGVEEMYKLGLCSITFRQLSVEEIIKIVAEARLNGIEWGSDVHVPVGDLETAKNVKKLTEEAGLEVASYGAYYRVGQYDENDESFEDVLATAAALGAPSIRIWAGSFGSDEADQSYREKVISETREIADLAEKEGILINFEYHGKTLTDTMESASQLMEEVDHPNVKIYWQPAVSVPVDERLESIDKIYPWLTDVHVFQWDVTKRLPLEEGREEWKKYLDRLGEENRERYLFLEFVKDNSVEQFMLDAGILRELMQEYHQLD